MVSALADAVTTKKNITSTPRERQEQPTTDYNMLPQHGLDQNEAPHCCVQRERETKLKQIKEALIQFVYANGKHHLLEGWDRGSSMEMFKTKV